MRKNDIVDIIWNSLDGISKKDISEVVDSFIAIVSKNVMNGEKVDIRKFGSFYRAEIKEKKIFSPIAKKMIDVDARFLIRFKSSKFNKGD